jgi:hypothetical protein
VREHLCRAFSFGRTAKGIFAMRLLHTARRKKTLGKKICLPCVLTSTHGKEIVCRAFFYWRTANNFPPTGRYPLWQPFPVRYLCRALGQGARQRHILCFAFSYGARQTYTFAVRFLVVHGKVFFLKWNFAFLFISPLKNIILYSIFQFYTCLN